MPTAAPTTFCRIATAVENRKNRNTCGPPTRSIERLAPKPIVVKNAICSGSCSIVSNFTGVLVAARAAVIASDTRSPPTTGAGMLYRSSGGTRRLMP